LNPCMDARCWWMKPRWISYRELPWYLGGFYRLHKWGKGGGMSEG
jgi:hypothetical protein